MPDLPDFPQPGIDAVNAPYWQALEAGELRFQACENGHAWLPPRTACPTCLSRTIAWKTACGRGRILSWVVYHTAYHESFRDRLPYNVALVELHEGPRLMTNILAPNDALVMDAPVLLSIDRSRGAALACFTLA